MPELEAHYDETILMEAANDRSTFAFRVDEHSGYKTSAYNHVRSGRGSLVHTETRDWK